MDAAIGQARGESALYRILGLSEGAFRVEYHDQPATGSINQSIARVLAQKKLRTKEWNELLELAPPLSAVLYVDWTLLDSQRSTLNEVQGRLIDCCDGKRMLVEVIDATGLEAVLALREFVALYQKGVVVPDPSQQPAGPPANIESAVTRVAEAAASQKPIAPQRSISIGADRPSQAPPEPRPSLARREPLTSHPPARTGPPRPRSHSSDEAPRTQRFPDPSVFEPPPERDSRPSQPAPGAYKIGRIAPRPEPPPPIVEVTGGTAPSERPPRVEVLRRPRSEPPPAYHDGARRLARSEPPPALLDTPRRAAHSEPPPPIVEVARAPSWLPPPVDGRPRAEMPSIPLPEHAERTGNPPRLGRYEVLARLGGGGMGTVYLCRLNTEVGFRRLFAIKLLSKQLRDDANAARMLVEEAQLAARIHHPNVIGIVDVGQHDGQPFVVMDYVEGGSLNDLFRRNPTRRPPRLVIPLLLDALNGLSAIHTASDEHGHTLALVHCDLSPHNLLVGVDGACRIADFGIAQSRNLDRASTEITRGKPGFMSPEQLTGGDVDMRSDVFAMGVVLWSALTGEDLFVGRTVEETIHNVLHREVPPPSRVGLAPPEALDWICRKALSRAPEDRFQTAEEMHSALRTVALELQLLAPAREISTWVTESFRPEIRQRRQSQAHQLSPSTQENKAPSVRPPPVQGASPASKLTDLLDQLPASDDRTRTVVLTPRKDSKLPLIGLWILCAAALAAVIAMLVWPDKVARLFSRPPAPTPVQSESSVPE